MGWGAWSSILNRLTIPQRATGARIVIGPDVPAELAAYYAPDTVVAAILKYVNENDYAYDAVVSDDAGVANFWAIGERKSGFGVIEMWSASPDDVDGVLWDFVARTSFGPGRIRFGSPVLGGAPEVEFRNTSTLDFDGSSVLRVRDRIINSRSEGFNAELNGTNPAGAPGLAYTDMPAGSSFNWTKDYAATAIDAAVAISWVSTIANMEGEFALQVNGTDYTVAKRAINPVGIHGLAVGFLKIPANTVPAGTYTVKARWRRTAASAAGQLSCTDDRCSARCTEVA